MGRVPGYCVHIVDMENTVAGTAVEGWGTTGWYGNTQCVIAW